MKIMWLELDKKKSLLVLVKIITSRMLTFARSVFIFLIGHRKTASEFSSRFFSRFLWLFIGIELLGIALLASKLYLYGDGLNCTMEGIQNEQQAKNETYLKMLRSFCAVYGHPPDRNETSKNEISKNETFIQSLDYFIVNESETQLIRQWLNMSIFACFVHLVYFLTMAVPGKKLFTKESPSQFFQLGGFFLVIFVIKCPIFMTSDLFTATNPEIFEFTESDSLFQFSTVLKIYWAIWTPMMLIVLLVIVLKMTEGEGDSENELVEAKERRRWNKMSEKLGKLYKAIGLEEKEASKQEDKAEKVDTKSSLCLDRIHSPLLNLKIWFIMSLVILFELLTCYYLVPKEAVLGNRVDCILKGIENEAQANSEPYRELVRNTCGMFGVPPNYMRFKHGNEFFFMRVPEVYVGKNHGNSTNGTFRVNHKNETFGGRPDYVRIRQEEELYRKHLVLVLVFLSLLQFFLLKKSWPHLRHMLESPSLRYMLSQILFLVLFLMIFVLCKSLTFGQTRLFSSDRVVFRGEQQALPILWYDLPKMEPESQASLFSYLLNPPKLDFEHLDQFNNTKELLFNESIAHHPHSDNKIYCRSYTPTNWYLPACCAVGSILVIFIIVKIIQIAHLLTHKSLFPSKPKPPSSDERWNSLNAKLDEIYDVVGKKDKESKQKEADLVEVTVTNADKPVKAD